MSLAAKSSTPKPASPSTGIADPAGRQLAFLGSDGTAFTMHPRESLRWRSPVVQEVEIDGFWAAVERNFRPLSDR